MFSSFAGRKVVITGGLGFIGSNLALAMARAGALVTIVDCLAPGCGGNFFNLYPALGQIKVFTIDLADEKALSESGIFQDRPDFVFSLAARISHVDSMLEPRADLHANVLGELNLLEMIRRHSPGTRVVHTGTRQVIGRPQFTPVNESHPVAPVDVNGIHKYCAEQYHRVYHQAYGIRSTVLRLTNTYGPRQLIKQSSQGAAGNFIGRALRQEPIQLFGGGEQTRDFNYVADVVEALALAALHEECAGQVYNLAGFNHSLSEFLEVLGTFTPLQVSAADFPLEHRQIDIGSYRGDAAKFSHATGWQARTGLPEGLSNTLEFFRENSARYL